MNLLLVYMKHVKVEGRHIVRVIDID